MNNAGLSTAEAEKRLAIDGENLIASSKKVNPAGIFAGQFKDAMVIILLIATAVSVTMGEYLDAAAIITVVVLNAILGFIQEYRAEKTLEALKKLSAPSASVYRDGRIVQLAAEKLVRGDVVRLESGGKIPADCRLINPMAFECDEALLTGESLPVSKRHGEPCFMGTAVTRGHALAEVVETGQSTQMGLISGMLSETEEERTPLQKKLSELGKIIGLICLIVCFCVSVLGVIQGYDLFEMMFTGISLAVAAIPEGLPAVVTISLALAVRRIYKQKALVNKLHSVETLGCANVICTDKTGTLTLNKMTVNQVFRLDESSGDLIFRCGALCNNAIRQSDGSYLGDPTEIALMTVAEQAAFVPGSSYERLDEIPFDSSSAFMQVTVRNPSGAKIDYLKGSLEAVLPKCGGLTSSERKRIQAAYDGMTKKALRCLAFAHRKTGEEQFSFIGIQGMSDPLRPEIKSAVRKCKKAGIRVIMLTGDHRNTAVEIARQAGIDEVHSRMTPADKLRIVRELKAEGNIVAMTGDGVNDAPAVKEAAIGVAMGIQGTDVTKEAAQLVLLDDNFATLVSAVEQGRTIYNNIRKSMRYMLSSNIGEVLTMLFAMLMGLPVVLIPIQILLINLVTDGLPAIALSMEPSTDDIMRQPPRKAEASIFAGGMFGSIIIRGLTIGICTLLSFRLVMNQYGLDAGRTAAMATLGLSQLIFVFECKDKNRGIFNAKYWDNPHLVLAVLASASLIFLCLMSGLLSPVLRTLPLERTAILAVLVFAAGVPVINGLWKLVFKEE
ncbi:MAG: cation-translocating P-type ATPase [Oscillospiraceae bacterium]|nr:cation-translocating P-type ATPase [Oscillospiraceae bacterium]